MNPELKDADIVIIDKALDFLKEHFDTVHIFATRHENDDFGTVQCNKGSGNWYARFGQISSWTVQQNEGLRKEVIGPDEP